MYPISSRNSESADMQCKAQLATCVLLSCVGMPKRPNAARSLPFGRRVQLGDFRSPYDGEDDIAADSNPPAWQCSMGMLCMGRHVARHLAKHA